MTAPWAPMTAPPLPCEPDPLTDDWLDEVCVRASGNVECSTCGMPYRKHLSPAPVECPTLVRVCDGRLLKL